MIYCNHCNAKSDPGDLHCAWCGKPIAAQPSAPQRQTYVPAPPPAEKKKLAVWLGVPMIIGVVALSAAMPVASPIGCLFVWKIIVAMVKGED